MVLDCVGLRDCMVSDSSNRVHPQMASGEVVNTLWGIHIVLP